MLTRLAVLLTLVGGVVCESADRQTLTGGIGLGPAQPGQAIATTTTTPGQVGSGILTANDVVFLGAIRLAVNTLADPGVSGIFTARKVNGQVRFIVAHGPGAAWSPVEFQFTNPTYDSNGVCTSAPPTCFQKDYTQAPFATVLTDYATNAPIINTVHDAWHGKEGMYQNSAGVMHSCNEAGQSGCIQGSMRWHDDATAPQGGGYLYLVMGQGYGNYEEGDRSRPDCDSVSSPGGPCQAFHLAASTLNSAAATTVTYGPWRVQSPADETATGTPASPAGTGVSSFGVRRAEYLLQLPDGSMGHGSAVPSGYQQGGMPDGPTLFGGATWPTSTTSTAYGSQITSQHTYMDFYAEEQVYGGPASIPGCSNITALQIVSFKQPGTYPYVHESQQGACLAIDPVNNGGIGTWTELSYVKSMEWITGLSTKRGVIAFAWQGTNHLGGQTTACTGPNGRPAHTYYSSGAPTVPCDHGCIATDTNITGPVYTFMEPTWLVFDPNDLNAVRDGTKTPTYSVTANNAIYPLQQSGWTINWPGGSAGTSANDTYKVGGTYYDTTTHILYIDVAAGDALQGDTDLIYAFLIKG